MADITFKKVELTENDILEMGDPNLIEDLYLKARAEYEAVIFEHLNKYGFTKEWLCDPKHKSFLKITRYESGHALFIDRITIYDYDIFSIAMVFESDGSGYKIVPHADPVEIKEIFGFPTDEEAANESD